MSPAAWQHPLHDAVTVNIVESAQQLFQELGFAEVSIDDIMAGAGLTRGSFYSYFGGKGAPFSAATERMIKDKMHGVGTGLGAAEIAIAMIRQYLSRDHYAAQRTGCPLIAQTGDRTRTDQAVRQAYELALTTLVDTFEKGAGPHCDLSRRRALALASLCVGSLTLGRAIDNPLLVDELRDAAMSTAMELGGWTAER